MPDTQGRDGHFYRKATAKLRRTADPICWICHGEIDLTLDYRHKMSWTADHEKPLSKGGKLLGKMHPAHRSCNSSRGVGERIVIPKPSRDW